uniref:Uncharacterized protein n=1 Tax=Anguilla anguilla TaxID=7936 RepID=A0A0E9XBG9_ANGAN
MFSFPNTPFRMKGRSQF